MCCFHMIYTFISSLYNSIDYQHVNNRDFEKVVTIHTMPEVKDSVKDSDKDSDKEEDYELI